jgi:hypothetical protein
MFVPGRTVAAIPDKNSVLAQQTTSKKTLRFAVDCLRRGLKPKVVGLAPAPAGGKKQDLKILHSCFSSYQKL